MRYVWGIAVIHRAIELGIDLLDTADMYGPLTHETLRPADGGLGSGFLTGCFQKVEDMPENDFRRHNALAIAAELGDARRFPTARSTVALVGLVPSDQAFSRAAAHIAESQSQPPQ